MRRLLFALLLIASPALGAEPKAVISGPTSAVVGTEVNLSLGGSAADPEFPLQVVIAGDAEFKPSLRVWLDDVTIKPGLAVLTAPRPGSYTVVVVAIGKPEGSDKTLTRIAAWPIEITAIPPAPRPDPDPPGPNPPDPKPPTPGPVTGKLWGVLVLPDLPSVAEAALRTDPDIRAAFAAKDTIFRSYLASEQEIQAPGWKAALAAAGGPPAVLWQVESGRIVAHTKAADEAGILAGLKIVRGGN